MTDLTLSIIAGADDGRNWSNLAFSSAETVLYLGSANVGGAQHTYYRFTSVTIPDNAQIDTAVIRFTGSGSWAGTPVNVNIYFEQEDNPAAPTSGSDLDGRSVGSPVAWSGIASWSAGIDYDSPDLASIFQTIIDRPGWSSGNAVTVHIKDNGSGTGDERGLASYNNTTYTEPRLIVTYSVPFSIDVSDSLEVSESLTIEFDLVRQENIDLTESVEVILGFDESLPTIAQDITLTESVTMIRGFAGVHTEVQNIEVSEYSQVALGFEISLFESITVYDTGNIRPEILTLDDINLSEYVLTRRGYDADVDDSFVFSDRFDVFHYSNWLRENAARANQRFFFTLTGATDSTTDIEIPASSIFARKRSGDPTYLQVTIPSFNYSTAIALRPSGEMLVDMGYEIDGEIGLRERILEADLEDISTYEGPVNRSIVLTGHRTQDFGGQVVTFNKSEVIYRGYQTRARSFRFAFIDPFLNPGDTVVVGLESFTCNNIVYTINALRTTMEVREAL